MATSQVLEGLTIGRSFLKLKFQFTVQVASLEREKFVIHPAEVDEQGEPFLPATPSGSNISLKEIIIRDDFNSIRKELMLNFADIAELDDETIYYALVIDGLRTASGHNVPAETIFFKYNFDNAPIDDATEEEPVVIQDFSIKTIPDEVVIGSTSFYIVETVPENGDIFIDKGYMSGTIGVRFSTRPNIVSVNKKNIKVQRKKIGGKNFRWEDIDTITALDADEPILYVYMPSIEATPVYYEDDKTYFEAGYKYRLKISKNLFA